MHNTVLTFFLKHLVPTADLCENVPLKALLLKCKDKTHLFHLVLFSGWNLMPTAAHSTLVTSLSHFAHPSYLLCQFSCWSQEDSPETLVPGLPQVMKDRNDEGCCLSGACGCACHDVTPLQHKHQNTSLTKEKTLSCYSINQWHFIS